MTFLLLFSLFWVWWAYEHVLTFFWFLCFVLWTLLPPYYLWVKLLQCIYWIFCSKEILSQLNGIMALSHYLILMSQICFLVLLFWLFNLRFQKTILLNLLLIYSVYCSNIWKLEHIPMIILEIVKLCVSNNRNVFTRKYKHAIISLWSVSIYNNYKLINYVYIFSIL